MTTRYEVFRSRSHRVFVSIDGSWVEITEEVRRGGKDQGRWETTSVRAPLNTLIHMLGRLSQDCEIGP